MVGRLAAAALAALLGATAAAADEAEIVALFDEYDAAFAAGRFAEAEVAGEAAWRAAEAEWGAREETAVLAFNLARLRLMQDRRAEAVEPALRVKELVDAGMGGASIAPEEAGLLATIAQFEAADPSREEIGGLEAALLAFTPGDFVGKRIAGMGWYDLTKARFDRRQWRRAYETAEQATLRLQGDADIPPALFGAIAVLGIKAAAEDEKREEALILAHRGILAFPAQAPGQPVDIVLGNLLGWDAGLHNLLDQTEGSSPEEHPETVWGEGRYPTVMGCEIEWIERAQPEYPTAALQRSYVMAMIFEYYLDADGTVIRVDPVGDPRETSGFADAVIEAISDWRASPQPRAECRGPWTVQFQFQIFR